MLPSIIVTPAPMNIAISVKVGAGRKFQSDLSVAIASTLPAPPARLAENTAMTDRPITSTIIWMKSVQATARKPPMTT